MSAPLFPLEIQELSGAGRTYVVYVRWHTTIKNIKDQLRNIIKGFPISRMQVFHSSSIKAISNQTTLHDLGIDQAGDHVLRLALMVVSSSPQYVLVSSKDINLDEECDYMLEQVQLGLHCGHKPTKTDMLDCTGGVYFMKSGSNVPFAVFKPSDEEQGMPNNPKGYAGNGDVGLREYFSPGEGYIRETASYILDKDNFCNVPPTTIVHCEHDTFTYPYTQKGSKPTFPKLGSLQKFIRAGDTFEDISPSKVGVLELQKIALLDMRLLNCDRNASNILVVRKPPASFYHNSSRSSFRKNANKKDEAKSRSSTPSSEESVSYATSQLEFNEFFFEDAIGSRYTPASSGFGEMYDLIPIDHGYCIPSKLHIDEFDWAWYTCPQIAAEVAPEIKEYMNSLDIDELLNDLLQQIALPEDCIFLLRVTHQLLVEGINAGLTLREIAALIARLEDDVPSPLEVAIAAADENALRAVEMRSERRTPHSLRASPGPNKSFCSPVRTSSRGSTIHMDLQSDSFNEEVVSQSISTLVQRQVSSKNQFSPDEETPSAQKTNEPGVVSPLRSLAAQERKNAPMKRHVTRPAAVHAHMPSSTQRGVRRIVNSVQDLSAMDTSTGSPEQLLKSNRNISVGPSTIHDDVADKNEKIGYLSSENIEKLQRSPDLLKFPLPFDPVTKLGAFQSPTARQSSKQHEVSLPTLDEMSASVETKIGTEVMANCEDDRKEEDDYFCGEIAELKLEAPDSPSKLPGYGNYLLGKESSTQQNFRHPGVSLGLSTTSRTMARPGDALSSMKSLDPAYLTPDASKTSFLFHGWNSNAQSTVPKTSSTRVGNGTSSLREMGSTTSRALGSELTEQACLPNGKQDDLPLSPSSSCGCDVHPLSVLGGSKVVAPEVIAINSPIKDESSESNETKADTTLFGTASKPIPCCVESGDGRSSSACAGDVTSSEASFSASAGSPRSFGETMAAISSYGTGFMAKREFSNTRFSRPVAASDQKKHERNGSAGESLHSLSSSSPPESSESSPKFKDEEDDVKTDSELEKLSHRPSTSLVKRKQSREALNIQNLRHKRTVATSGHQSSRAEDDDNSSIAPELQDLSTAIPLNFIPRVASFGAFDSPPLYDVQSSERHVSKLRKERRRAMMKTQEYQQLRLVFAKESVTNIVSRESRAKLRSGGRSDTF